MGTEIEEFENFKETLKKLYFRIKKEVIEKGHLKEIEWCNNIPNPKELDKKSFFREYVWVVISSGMNNQITEQIFNNFLIDINNFDFDAIRHPNKNKAIKKVYNRLDFYFDHFLKSKNKLLFLKNLPHIGDITKYHLARNLGLNYAKPDRHLVRIANHFNYNDVQKFCKKISDLTNEKIGVVDIVFWRFANITKNYLEIIEDWLQNMLEVMNQKEVQTINKRIVNSISPQLFEINHVYLGDNLNFLKQLRSGLIDLIYIDPPYCSEEDYIEFSDKWENISGYLGYMKDRILEMHRILKKTGCFYLQCDLHGKFELKLLCDNVFGKKNFRREIIWNVGSVSGFKSKVKGWVRQHDSILYYTKSNNFTFNKQYIPYSVNYIEKMFRFKDEDGRIYRKRRDGRQYLDESNGKRIGSVWNDILSFQTRTRAKEYYKYPTQKPLGLLKRIIAASSNEGDLIADFFCGSGTTLVAAKILRRDFIGCDNNPNAIKLCKKRLAPFSRRENKEVK